MNTPFPETSTEEYRKQTHCPSCGRFSGIFTRCPYCQAGIPKRLSIRVFKVIAVLTSTVGLLLLLFFAQTVKSPLVTIAELGPLSNFAHVRMEGVVSNSYGIHPKWGSLGFTLEQPGKEGQPLRIRISAYSKVAKEIGDQNKVPVEGDQISIEGQVRFQKDTPSLLINASEHLTILRKGKADKPDEVLAPEQITESMMGQNVRIVGLVTGTRSFETGDIIRLNHGQQGFPVWVPIRCRPEQSIVKGMKIEAAGKVKSYKDALEVEVLKPNSVKILAIGEAVPTQEGGE